MGVDLTANLNQRQFVGALIICMKARDKNLLNEVQAKFVRQMESEWDMNGEMFEPTIKQFNWLKQIAYDNEGFI